MNKATIKYRVHGLSLVELMTALAIGSLLMMGLLMSFKNSSDSQRELMKSGELMENGRYAINMIAEDLRHTGFYGYYYDLGTAPSALQDPCEIANMANLQTAMGMPVQGYEAASYSADPNITATSCDDKGVLNAGITKNGSDILVIRRADTVVVDDAADLEDGEIYIQSNARSANMVVGVNGASNFPATRQADGSTTALLKYPAATGDPTPADTRKYRVHTYYITHGGTDTLCSATSPTLNRLELTQSGGTTAMTPVALVDGIEYMKVEYGIDTFPTTTDTVTGMSGDGIPDAYVEAAAMNISDWPLVVSVRVYILARSPERTDGHDDQKTYTLGTSTVAACGDEFKRKVFSAEVRPTNLAGRREIPN